MLDVLDADWQEREAQDEADPAPQDIFKLRRNCLLIKYLSNVRGRSSALKRVVGAIFVDGGSEDLRAYPEVFTNETLEIKAQNGQKRKREDDFEHKFGDYNDDEDDLEFESGTPAPSQETDDVHESSLSDPWMGGPESIALRQRILVLVSGIIVKSRIVLISPAFTRCVLHPGRICELCDLVRRLLRQHEATTSTSLLPLIFALSFITDTP